MTMNQYIVFWSLIRKSKAAPGPQHTDPDRPEGWLARPRRTSTSICWTPSWVPSCSRLSYRSVKTPIAREKGEAVDLFAIEMIYYFKARSIQKDVIPGSAHPHHQDQD